MSPTAIGTIAFVVIFIIAIVFLILELRRAPIMDEDEEIEYMEDEDER